METNLKEFIYFNKKKILGIILIIVLITLVGIYYLYDKEVLADNISEEEIDIVFEEDNDTEEIEEEQNNENCYFDIKGEVKTPGVYSIECNKRIVDAISLAGGLTDKSDTSVTNLSKVIVDGMVIKIYSKTEVENYLETINEENILSKICEDDNIQSDSCISDSDTNNTDTKSSLININTASLEELMTLSGIGEAKAQNIITYRTTNPFKTIEDIMNVDGIGENIFANIKENITV